MRVHVLQHVGFEGPAYIARWAALRGCQLTTTRLDLGQTCPTDCQPDLLAIMGGPMSIHEQTRYPWLTREKRYIEQVIEQGRPVLGICLGAQLIADVLGAAIRNNPCKEIGWFEVSKTPQAGPGTFFADLPERFPAFHWHGQTFDLPAGSVHLARSQACENQAFQYAGHVLALQFHLEITGPSIAQLIQHGRDDLTDGPYVQHPAAMHRSTTQLAAVHRLMAGLLDRLTSIRAGSDDPS